MKRIFTLLALLSYLAFGYNFNGVWINKTGANYNDPVKIIIKNGKVTPLLNRNGDYVRLKTKYATHAGNGYFEVWGFKNKSIALFIAPVNSSKIRVIAKKINPAKKRIITKSFLFARKGRAINLNQFVGDYRSRHNNLFTAISRIHIYKSGGKLYVKAWRNTARGERPLGIAPARLVGNRLYMEWEKRAILVKANILGLRKNGSHRFQKIQLTLEARNLRTNIYNKQTLVLTRDNCQAISAPVEQIEEIFNTIYGY